MRQSWQVARSVGVVLTAAAVVAGMGACSSQGSGGEPESPTGSASESPAAPAELVKASVFTDINFSGVHAPLFAGKAEGIFEKHGIDLEIIAGNGSVENAQKVSAGAVDFELDDAVAVLQVMGQGADLQIIGAVEHEYPGGICTVAGAADVSSPADLEGLSVGAPAGDAYLVPLPELMAQDGAEGTFEFVPLSLAGRMPALLSGNVDAIACGYHGMPNYVAAADEAGQEINYLSYAEHGFDVAGWVLATRESLVQESPELVQSFVQAVWESFEWSVANSEAAVDHFVRMNPEQDADKSMAIWLNQITLIEDAVRQEFAFPDEKLSATVEFTNDAYDLELSTDAVYDSIFANALAG